MSVVMAISTKNVERTLLIDRRGNRFGLLIYIALDFYIWERARLAH